MLGEKVGQSSRGGGPPPLRGGGAPFQGRDGATPVTLMRAAVDAPTCSGFPWKKVEYLSLNPIVVRGALALPPPLKNVAGPEKFPLMFLIKACAIKKVFQGGNWLNS